MYSFTTLYTLKKNKNNKYNIIGNTKTFKNFKIHIDMRLGM